MATLFTQNHKSLFLLLKCIAEVNYTYQTFLHSAWVSAIRIWSEKFMQRYKTSLVADLAYEVLALCVMCTYFLEKEGPSYHVSKPLQGGMSAGRLQSCCVACEKEVPVSPGSASKGLMSSLHLSFSLFPLQLQTARSRITVWTYREFAILALWGMNFPVISAEVLNSDVWWWHFKHQHDISLELSTHRGRDSQSYCEELHDLLLLLHKKHQKMCHYSRKTWVPKH